MELKTGVAMAKSMAAARSVQYKLREAIIGWSLRKTEQ